MAQHKNAQLSKTTVMIAEYVGGLAVLGFCLWYVFAIALPDSESKPQRDTKLETPISVTHLAMTRRNALVDAQAFYAQLELGAPSNLRVTRDGDRMILTTSADACATLRSLDDTIPNGIELECRDRDTHQSIWLTARDQLPK